MIFQGKSSFTSDPIQNVFLRDIYFTVTGPAEVKIELLEEDGVWRSFPETTISGTSAVVIAIKAGFFRVVIGEGEATTVTVAL